jgi:hydroxypyruvate reductase/glycerate 2-kinase
MAKELLSEIFSSVLHAVDPYLLIKDYAKKLRADISQGNVDKLIIVGFGKAAFQMAFAAEEVLGPELIKDGIVVTKYGHAKRQQPAASNQQSAELRKIKVFEAAHPVPDEKGFKAAEEIIKLLEKTGEETLVLCLVSGGGSALLVAPYEGIALSEKQMITDLLLKAGADISELNSVRKHLSRVKGGRLAEIIAPARTISLMISDVIGDRLDVIASGPTAPDTATYKDALDVIEKYGLKEQAPASVMDVLQKGREGMIPETPKEGSPVFNKVNNVILCNNRKAIEAAKEKAESMGYRVEILADDLTGEARDVGRWLAEKALKTSNELRVTSNKKRVCLISGGETTVTVKGKGKGGRNTELALSFAMAIEGVKGISLLSAGTDGTDGPTDAAGAIVDGETIKKAKSLGLNPEEYLSKNDSYNFFKETDSLLITGPTGTNVMDVQIVLVEQGESDERG